LRTTANNQQGPLDPALWLRLNDSTANAEEETVYKRQDYHPDQRPEAEPRTARQMTPAIGAEVEVRFESIIVYCTVRDVKNSYGRCRLLVEPMSGAGEQWIEPSRIVATVNLSHNNFAARLEE
jgi:hypothetical protein